MLRGGAWQGGRGGLLGRRWRFVAGVASAVPGRAGGASVEGSVEGSVATGPVVPAGFGDAGRNELVQFCVARRLGPPAERLPLEGFQLGLIVP